MSNVRRIVIIDPSIINIQDLINGKILKDNENIMIVRIRMSHWGSEHFKEYPITILNLDTNRTVSPKELIQLHKIFCDFDVDNLDLKVEDESDEHKESDAG